MITNQTICKNCEQSFDEDCKFCPNCGQKNNEDLTIGVLFYNTISNYLSFDARFLRSFIPLMFRPGILAKRFVAGKRLLYLHPGQMYLFVSVLFFFVFSFTVNDWIIEVDKEIAENKTTQISEKNINLVKDPILNDVFKAPLYIDINNPEKIGEEMNKAIDSLKPIQERYTNSSSKFQFGFSKQKLDSLRQQGFSDIEIMQEMGMEEDANIMTRGFYNTLIELSDGNGPGKLIKRFVDTIPIAMFFLLPLFAFMLKIFYFKRGRYAYHLVFSFYFFSFLFTVFTILLAFDRFVNDIPIVISVLTVLSTFLYFYLSVLNFYKRNWFTTLIKSSIITFIFLLMVIPLALGIIGGFVVAGV